MTIADTTRTGAPAACATGDVDRPGPRFEQDFSGLLTLASGGPSCVWVDGRWLVPDDGSSPLLVLASTSTVLVDLVDVLLRAPSRRALVLVAPSAPLTVGDADDPLLALTRLTVAGCGALHGSTFVLDDVGALDEPGLRDLHAVVYADREPLVLASRHGRPLVAAFGTHVWVASTAAFADRLLGAQDNVALVVHALRGTGPLPVLGGVASSGHADPLLVDASASTWSLPVAPTSPVPLDSPEFGSLIRRAARALPEDVHEALMAFADRSHRSGALLVRGVPVGEIPETPADPASPTAKDRSSELVLLAAGRVLGHPVGYLPEHGGEIVQNLIPTRAGAYRQVSTSSAVTLAWHTEAAFHPHRPRFLLLLCLRGDPHARTTLCSIREVLGALSLRSRWLLSEPLYRTSADESYVGVRPTQKGRLVPVLSGDLDEPRMVFDADLMTAVTAPAAEALDELLAAIQARHTSVVLAAGDLLVVDNSVAVHGRSPFTPRFDGTDRWLQRTFVVADLSASAGERTGAVINTRFQP